MLTKEEYLNALEMIVFVEGYMNLEHMLKDNHACALKYKFIYDLINEHFDNPPLTFEELKPKMWVWDNERKRYDQILEINVEPNRFYFRYIDGCFYFEENRFYRKQVE